MEKTKFGIVGWITFTNVPLSEQLLFGGITFDSFEDGWGWIYENVSEEDNAYDDLFVRELEKENN